MEDIPCCQRTLYSYVDKQYLSVINLDLPRKVRYKKRKKKQLDTPVPGYRKNRTYRDLLDFLASSHDSSIVELDVVEGAGGQIRSCPPYSVLSELFPDASFLLPGDRRKYVQDVFDLLLSELGPQTYSQLFPIILTDNGSSFLDPSLFEMPHRQDVLTKVFYCDPMSSWQKGRLEKNHEFIRYILPKGTSFDSLTEQKVNLMMNHINSTARASLNGCTPFQLALLLLDAKLMSLMDLRSVPADQIHLKPDLIK
ncbi:MAG: transposase [Blautia wexlerae]